MYTGTVVGPSGGNRCFSSCTQVFPRKKDILRFHLKNSILTMHSFTEIRVVSVIGCYFMRKFKIEHQPISNTTRISVELCHQYGIFLGQISDVSRAGEELSARGVCLFKLVSMQITNKLTHFIITLHCEVVNRVDFYEYYIFFLNPKSSLSWPVDDIKYITLFILNLSLWCFLRYLYKKIFGTICCII